MRDEEAQAAEEYGSRREAEPGKTEPVSGKLLGRGEALIRGTRREHTYSEMDLYGGDEVTKEIVSVSPYPTQLTGVPREEEPWPRRGKMRWREAQEPMAVPRPGGAPWNRICLRTLRRSLPCRRLDFGRLAPEPRDDRPLLF